MKKKKVLIEIIEQLFAFDVENQSNEKYSMNDFIGYLNAKYKPNDLEMRKIEGEKEKWIKEDYRDREADISILFSLMYRYSKVYTKKALEGSLIGTPEEFSFLASLMTYESLTKTELINEQVMEKTSGTEIIKRLLKQKLIKEFADSNDKRSVRVSITEKGKKEVLISLPKMQFASKIFVGNLNDPQINTLAYLLKKLDYYHNEIFLNRKNLSLEELNNNIYY